MNTGGKSHLIAAADIMNWNQYTVLCGWFIHIRYNLYPWGGPVSLILIWGNISIWTEMPSDSLQWHNEAQTLSCVSSHQYYEARPVVCEFLRSNAQHTHPFHFTAIGVTFKTLYLNELIHVCLEKRVENSDHKSSYSGTWQQALSGSNIYTCGLIISHSFQWI